MQRLLSTMVGGRISRPVNSSWETGAKAIETEKSRFKGPANLY